MNQLSTPKSEEQAELSLDLQITDTGRKGTASLSPVRIDRVNALRAAIASGGYAVSSAAVADKLMQRMLCLR